jgi:hypothetical protein
MSISVKAPLEATETRKSTDTRFLKQGHNFERLAPKLHLMKGTFMKSPPKLMGVLFVRGN